MRTTLDIEDDVLPVAKELGRREGLAAGQVLSQLARRGLAGGATTSQAPETIRGGVPVLPSRGEVVTLAHVEDLVDPEGI